MVRAGFDCVMGQTICLPIEHGEIHHADGQAGYIEGNHIRIL